MECDKYSYIYSRAHSNAMQTDVKDVLFSGQIFICFNPPQLDEL